MRQREDALRQREETFRKRLNEELDTQVRQARARNRRGHRRAEGEGRGDRADGAAAGVDRRDRHGAQRRARGGRRRRRADRSNRRERRRSQSPDQAASRHQRPPCRGRRPGDRRRPGARRRSSRPFTTAPPISTCAASGCARSVRDLRVVGGRDGAGGRHASTCTSICSRARRSPADLNVIGCTVDEAIARAERFLDESLLTDQRVVRFIHGYGTGQLKRALTGFSSSIRWSPASPPRRRNRAAAASRSWS